MIIETAIGDAYGAAFEFVQGLPIGNSGERFYDHPAKMASDGSGVPRKAGCYTDDTQMTIAVSEAIILIKNGVKADKQLFAQSFLNAFHRDPIPAYSPGFYRFMLDVTSSEQFLKTIETNSTRNGAAMRSVPVGLLSNIDEVIHVSDIQSSTTHDTLNGRDSARIIALAAFYIRLHGRKNLVEFLNSMVPGYNLEIPFQKRVPCCGMSSAKAVITNIMASDSMKTVLTNCIYQGGDTDTTAALAMGLMSLDKSIVNDLPLELYRTLNDGRYGKQYCLDLDRRLTALI